MVGALPKAASRREIDITDSKLVIILAPLQEKIKLGDLPFVSLHHNIFLRNVLQACMSPHKIKIPGHCWLKPGLHYSHAEVYPLHNTVPCY